tara:strand:- start:1991 stop:2194 length:204 start_codon:yes stop_codon:yes gene_type:complete
MMPKQCEFRFKNWGKAGDPCEDEYLLNEELIEVTQVTTHGEPVARYFACESCINAANKVMKNYRVVY